MKYKIVIDSCGELPFQYQNDIHFERVPLGLEVEGGDGTDREESELL